MIIKHISNLEDRPYTFEMDYSNYDATQSQFLRECVDKSLSYRLFDLNGVIGDVNPD